MLLVIFRLVWDFGGRLFDLFLEPLFGAKKSPFFNPQRVPNHRENYQSEIPPLSYSIHDCAFNIH
jgi:hypothetical protein